MLISQINSKLLQYELRIVNLCHGQRQADIKGRRSFIKFYMTVG